jgi:hypothetical protein
MVDLNYLGVQLTAQRTSSKTTEGLRDEIWGNYVFATSLHNFKRMDHYYDAILPAARFLSLEHKLLEFHTVEVELDKHYQYFRMIVGASLAGVMSYHNGGLWRKNRDGSDASRPNLQE